MRARQVRAAAAAGLAMLWLTVPAGPAGGLGSPAPAPVIEATLDNGLRVLILADGRSPVVSVQTWYRVGTRDERPGATGLAHFLEHMMFKGTPAIGKGEFARAVTGGGGQYNAFTSHDVTGYHVDIATDQVEQVLALEADRMRHLLLDPQEVEAERQVVLEERRTRVDDHPDGRLAEEFSAIAYMTHPYGWPVIGWMDDIRRITAADLRAFYDTYYVPNNAILAVVGDVDPARLLARVRELFGRIPRGSEPPAVTAVEPPQGSNRRVTVRSEGARLPAVHVGWHVPNHRSSDAPALELLARILSDGRASRLYRTLVYEQRLALAAGADYQYFALDPSLFWFWATARPGQTPDSVERALLAEIEALRADPLPEEELARARNQVEAAFAWGQDSVHARASTLSRFELLGSWRLMDRFVPSIRAVTAADLQRVARAYFPADRRNVGILLPAADPASAGR